MGSQRLIGFSLFVIMVFFIGFSECYQFNVGGKDGWVLHPSENYTLWPHRHRFQVNDTLFFKYKKGSDSVLVVSKEDFQSCNTQNPKQSLTDGDSVFKFDRSGPFYFISGDSDHCKNGQKLIVIVMAVRHKPSNSPPTPSSSPVESPAPSPADFGTQPPPPAANAVAGGFGGFVWVVLGVSFGVSVMFGSFV